jgi:ribosomal protein L7/L12
MNTVVITGWNPGLDKIALTKIIRKHTGLGLAEGKQCTDQILDKKPVRFKNLNKSTAKAFLAELQGLAAMRTTVGL